MPLFTGERMQESYDEGTASNGTSNPYGIGFYGGSHCKQMSMLRRFCSSVYKDSIFLVQTHLR